MATLAEYRRVAWFWFATCLSAVSCEQGARPASRWVAEIDTVGDTVVVRTVAGNTGDSVATLEPVFQIGEFEGPDEYLFGDIQGLAVDSEGAVYIADTQLPAVRKYGPDGHYVMTLGREGSGPGEYRKGADALAILPDGRVMLRDQGNSRFQLWTPDGRPAGNWQLTTGFSTGRIKVVFKMRGAGILVDTAGFVYRESLDFRGFAAGGTRDAKASLVKYSPDNVALDTLEIPDWPYDAPTITATFRARSGDGGMSGMTVPFSPTEGGIFHR